VPVNPRNSLWTDVTLSEHAHERAALNFIRDKFPDQEPFRAWANFTFQADDGSLNEVDLLVVAKTGIYLVEIKSHPGRMEGDAGQWRWFPPDNRPTRLLDHPVFGADRKAKRLKSLLQRQNVFRGPKGVDARFFIHPVVFLSDPTLRVALSEEGRAGVFGPDPSAEGQVNDLPGILDLFKKSTPGQPPRVGRPLSEAIAKAMDSAGIKESVALRAVGPYRLGELLDEGEGWQDYAAENPQVKGESRRVRIYFTDSAVSHAERDAQQKAARREYLVLREFVHPGADRAIELLDSERGPALVFEWDANAVRLDQWLRENDDRLDLSDRITLVQNLAEIVQQAHRLGIFHRALSPRTVRVRESDRGPQLRIADWQTALRARTTSMASLSSTMLGTSHVAGHVAKPEQLYLAPELAVLDECEPLPSDIYSLGSLAVLILAGRPPAPDADGISRLLRENDALTLSGIMDSPGVELERLVATATHREAHRRYVSVQDFLDQLLHAFDSLTQPDRVDPLEAQAKANLEAGWTVVRRVGSGSTSIVLVATTPDGKGTEALKVARSEDYAPRLRAEHETLAKLRDRTVVQTHGLTSISGRTVLRLEVAEGTLGDEIRRNGRLSLDLLERYGSDLLQAVHYLDQEGIWHRDVKPDNLGIAPRGKDDERRLVLLDFSLAGTRPDELAVGTRGYIDPFLSLRPSKRWDEQAERYAAAVTLYEMATGTRPTWGDGSSDPALLKDELPTIDAGLMDPSVREGLVAFFSTALHRDPARRFDTASEMRRAWGRIFEGQAVESDDADLAVEIADLDLSAVTKKTLLSELPLKPQVRDALERLDLTSVVDLVNVPGGDLVRISGIGAATRADVNHLARRLRDHLSGATGNRGSVDYFAHRLVPTEQAGQEHRQVAEAILGLVDAEAAPPWPSLRDAIELTGLSEAAATSGLTMARKRWSKDPAITQLRNEVREFLAVRGGIAGAQEIADHFLAKGSVTRGAERTRLGRALVRAAVETEGTLQSPSFRGRRLGAQYLVVLDGPVDVGGETTEWDAERLVEAAARLGEVASRLARKDPLPERDEVLEALRRVKLPEGLPVFSDARLVRLSAAAAEHVAVSSQLGLYPQGMPADRALTESRSHLLNRRGLTEEVIRSRVASRFPEAQELPPRPELDHLLEGLGLQWNSAARIFTLPSRGGVIQTMTSLVARSLTTLPDEAEMETRALNERLAVLRDEGGFLAVVVDFARLDRAVPAMMRVLGARRIDLDTLLVERLRARIEGSKGGDWSKVLAADAPGNDRGRTKLMQVVRSVLPEVEAEVLATEGTVLLTGLGLLARYEQIGLVERLRDAVTVSSGAHPLQAVVALIPSPTGGPPTIDGHTIPVITANQWARLGGAWLSEQTQGEAA
jgi:serine/threonine protein kinase